MKIICESKKEYDELMIASKYLHDFRVYVECINGKCNAIVENESFNIKKNDSITLSLNNDSNVINFITHLYLSESDFPDKNKFVYIE